MAFGDSFIEITEGQGTKVDSRKDATSGRQRTIVVLGDPTDPAGMAPVDPTDGLKVDIGQGHVIVDSGSVAVTSIPDVILGAGNQTIGKIGNDSGSPVVSTEIPNVFSGWEPTFDAAIADTVMDAAGAVSKFGGVIVTNLDPANDAYLQLFNSPASGVVLGTTVPRIVIPVPKGQSVLIEMKIGVYFGGGISYAATTTPTGATPAVTPLVGNILSKT